MLGDDQCSPKARQWCYRCGYDLAGRDAMADRLHTGRRARADDIPAPDPNVLRSRPAAMRHGAMLPPVGSSNSCSRACRDGRYGV